MQPPRKRPILQLQYPVRYLLIPTFGECHDFLIHPIGTSKSDPLPPGDQPLRVAGRARRRGRLSVLTDSGPRYNIWVNKSETDIITQHATYQRR